MEGPLGELVKQVVVLGALRASKNRRTWRRSIADNADGHEEFLLVSYMGCIIS